MRRYGELIPGLVAGVLFALAFWAGLFFDPEHFFEDILFSPRPVHQDIVIVAIDDKSIQAIGQWPWRREVFAELLQKLAQVKPKAVGIDVMFAEPSRYGAGDDARLANVLKTASFPVVLPIEAQSLAFKNEAFPTTGASLWPKTEFNVKGVLFGYSNVIVDQDGVVRRLAFRIYPNDEPWRSSFIPAFSEMVVGHGTIAEQTPYVRPIVFAGPPGTVRHISFVDILRDPEALKTLAGRYVFVGSTAPDLHDDRLTPFSRGVPMSGVEIHAQAANMLLQGLRLDPLPSKIILIWIILAGLLPALAFVYSNSAKRGLMLGIASGLIHAPAAILLFENGFIPNMLHVHGAWLMGLGASLAYRHFVTEREKRELRKVFSKYVSPDVLEEILKRPEEVRLGGEEKEATIFFSDVRGFTTLSEQLTPTELTQFLNRYFTKMTTIALERRGVVDKYIGDAIMAFWGAPLQNPHHTLDAILASLDMIDALHEFNAESVREGGLSIDIGIGLNSGSVVAGNMGSDQRFDYTVMGDAVNLASRLEGQTKTYAVHILTSEFTLGLVSREKLEEYNILAREIDRVRVKGKTKPVVVYEIVERGRVQQVRKILADFNRMRDFYYAGTWHECVTLGKKILAQEKDGPTAILVGRAEHFLHEPPHEWQGVYELKTK